MNNTKVEQKIKIGALVKSLRKAWPYGGRVYMFQEWDGMYGVERKDGRTWTDTFDGLEVLDQEPTIRVEVVEDQDAECHSCGEVGPGRHLIHFAHLCQHFVALCKKCYGTLGRSMGA